MDVVKPKKMCTITTSLLERKKGQEFLFKKKNIYKHMKKNFNKV